MAITLQQIKSITNQKESLLIPFVDPLNDTLSKFSINTPTQIVYFLSQVAHESGCFRYTEELASGTAYEGRADLGNTTSGDGIRFKGRGLIQLTGKNNYKKLSDYFGVNFVSNPYMLKSPEWACKSAGWFWSVKNLNKLTENNDFLMITYLVNGGFNGLAERLRYMVKAFGVFGLDDIEQITNIIFSIVSDNITATKDTHFKKMLFKEVPTKEILEQAKKIALNS